LKSQDNREGLKALPRNPMECEIFGRLYSIESVRVGRLLAQLIPPLDNNSSVGRPGGLGA
jgi:hypothetical protein